jgi:hypothetical protein
MKAELLQRRRIDLGGDAFVEIILWRVPKPVRGCSHSFKYRLALVESEICTLRYDNEAGKGDHRHVDGLEQAYDFTSVDRLMDDFMSDANARMQK